MSAAQQASVQNNWVWSLRWLYLSALTPTSLAAPLSVAYNTFIIPAVFYKDSGD
jgi:hypothetical protein